MIEHARREAAAGKRVVVVMLSSPVAKDMNQGNTNSNLRFCSLGSCMNGRVDIVRLRVFGVPDAIVYVDHAVIEHEFGALFEQLHRFDEPPVETNEN